MTRIQNSIRKDGTYYFRRIIRLGNDKPFRIRLSLRTTDHCRARIMTPTLVVKSEALRMSMMQTMNRDGLTADQRAEIFRRQMLRERDRLEAGHAQLQLADLGDQLPEEALETHLDLSEAVSGDLARNGETGPLLVIRIPPEDPETGEEPPIEILTWEDYIGALAGEDANALAPLHLSDLQIPLSPLNLQMAKRIIHQASVQAIREYREIVANPGAVYLPALMAPPAPYVAPAPAPALSAPRPPAADALINATDGSPSPWRTMTPSEAAAAFIEANPRTGGLDGNARKKGPSWTEKTREQFKLPALLLEQIMEGRPLASVTDIDLGKLNAHFNRLHGPSFRKSPKHRTMTIQEIADQTDALVRAKKISEEEIGLGIGTTNRHWGFLRQLTDWFARHHNIVNLDYSAFIIADDRDPRTLRDTYSIEEGRQLFGLAPWSGSASISRRFAPGKTIVHDACYFVPLIAWYTGLRREEICGLELADIEQEDGIWHFNIRDNTVRKLKTKTSNRLVPFADELVRLGLPDYVRAMRDAGETLLFPELTAESGKGTLGDAFYKLHWVKIASRLPFIERGQAMHSFRHTLADELKANMVDQEVRADLVGHKISSETGGRYSKATRLAHLRDAVAKVPVVTEHLEAAPISLLPPAKRRPRRARQHNDLLSN
ncbi:integrase [Sphingopyxis terrae subsp. terrae NBRC 15098]|uniref:Integrase n=1 Tax=Sphingopyxis terrae subsp. terrae NBRC 15098 TaxID=1219058 RepID=A0A142VVN0_9SPHN|nr:site-specific integrase [Sphingopyxis terrae]AMU93878.1 integrase [Sphingopyxis terrae subsp. terrae NBRC 15098]